MESQTLIIITIGVCVFIIIFGLFIWAGYDERKQQYHFPTKLPEDKVNENVGFSSCPPSLESWENYYDNLREEISEIVSRPSPDDWYFEQTTTVYLKVNRRRYQHRIVRQKRRRV